MRDRAAELRFPKYDPEQAPGQKIMALEEYISQTAIGRAELLTAQDWLLEARKALRDQWDAIEGHTAQLKKDATQAQVDAAKRRIKPEVYDGLDAAKEMLGSIERQVRRLEKDYDAASRTYTLITGTA